MRQSVVRFTVRYASLPLDETIHREAAAAELLILEGRAALDGGNYHRAADRFSAAQSRFDNATRRAERALAAYMTGLPEWRAWYAATLDWSRRENRAAIVVDKLAHTCSLIVGGRIQVAFNVEFGPNWIGDKRHQGDKATPEGRYRVVRKKEEGQTRYHRALLIDYPNEDDRRRFDTFRRNGDLSDSVGIGGLIELHGGGGRGVHWTDGCVALTNEDMERLYELTEVGTPVVIVGALTE